MPLPCRENLEKFASPRKGGTERGVLSRRWSSADTLTLRPVNAVVGFPDYWIPAISPLLDPALLWVEIGAGEDYQEYSAYGLPRDRIGRTKRRFGKNCEKLRDGIQAFHEPE